MAQKVISWVLVGIFTYACWWFGFAWGYLNSDIPAEDWSNVYLLFILISIVVLIRCECGQGDCGDGMFDRLVKTVTDFLPNIGWLVVAILVGNTIFMLQYGTGFSVDEYVKAVVVAVTAGLTTALWVGAIDNAG